jgi:hypothetical protein
VHGLARPDGSYEAIVVDDGCTLIMHRFVVVVEGPSPVRSVPPTRTLRSVRCRRGRCRP